MKTMENQLKTFIQQYTGVAVGFSSGVDSTLLAYLCHELHGENAHIYTLQTPYVASWEIEGAKQIAAQYGWNHKIIELGVPDTIENNPPDRCYLCKKELFSTITQQAKADGAEVVFDGSNTDDSKDYRPGHKALKELQVVSPFVECGMGKDDIRALSKKLGLPTWNKPAYACLLTRLPHNEPVCDEKLRQVEHAEYAIHQMGYPAVRVRHHGPVARLEFPKELIPEIVKEPTASQIRNVVIACGFKHVAVEICGYQMGSLNEIAEE